MAGQAITCPFAPCGATLTTIPERQRHDPRPLHRIPLHDLDGHGPMGSCPASLMAHPPGAAERRHLTEAEGRLLRIEADRELSHINPDDPRPPAAEPAGPPSPLFRGGDGNRQTGPNDGQVGYRRLPVKYLPGNDMGGTMASAGEVRAALDHANRLIAGAQSAANAAAGELSQAEQMIDWIRRGGNEPLGGPQVAAAIDKFAEITTLLHAAIEANQTYGADL